MNLFFAELDSYMTVYVALPGIGVFDVCSQDFLRFASLCGVFPLYKVLVRGIVQSLRVLSTFVLGGG